MRILRPVGALVVVALVLSACVAAPGASPDPSAAAAASASPSAAPSESPAGRKVVCPPLPLDPSTGAMVATIEALEALGGDAAPCYGNAKLQVTGYVPDLVGLGGTVGYAYQPDWLYGPFSGAVITAGRPGNGAPWTVPSLDVNAPPSIGSCAGSQDAEGCVLHQYLQSWVTVVGHYNDPASSTCTATPVAQDAPPIPPAASELECLRHFVLDSVAAFTDTGPLPPVDAGMCPVEPITVDQLVGGTASVGPQYGLGCLGAKEISFTAYVVPGVGLLSGMEQVTVEPRWLADPLNTGAVLAVDAAAADDAAGWLVVRTPPDVPADFVTHACDGSATDPATCVFAPYVGGYVTVTGHYDDPESLTCREVVGPGGPLLDRDALVLSCREQLVVDAVAPAQGPEPTATPPVTSTK